MSSSGSDWKFLGVTAILVALIAVPTLGSLMLSDDLHVKDSRVLRAQEQKMREPASLPNLGSPKKQVVIKDIKNELNNLLSNNLISYDFSCTKTKTNDFSVDGAFLQLKGKDCSKGTQSPKLSIVNKSNGFTAAVFILNSKEYQTDLIQLKEGMNHITIQYQTPSGQLEEYVLNVKAGTI